MGVSVILESERGDPLSPWLPYPFDDLAEKQPRPENKNFRCLCFIDPYGNAIFNEQQMDQLRQELIHLMSLDIASEIRIELEAIEQLARRCEGEMHTYLKFYGD